MLTLLLATRIFCVMSGTTTEVEVVFTGPFANGGTIWALNRHVAIASGYIAPGSSQATVTVEAISEGETALYLTSPIYLPSGPRFYPVQIGQIVVDDTVGVTVSPANAVVAVGTPVMLSAITSGSDVTVAWYEGERYLGIGHSISPTLDRGEHRITAQAWNRCGTVTGEALVSVIKPRQRAVRH